jgi:hypothetical protein
MKICKNLNKNYCASNLLNQSLPKLERVVITCNFTHLIENSAELNLLYFINFGVARAIFEGRDLFFYHVIVD